MSFLNHELRAISVLYRTSKRSASVRSLYCISLQLKARAELFSIAHRKFSKLVTLYKEKKTRRSKKKL